ncbi:hypothetical protein KIN20_008385 [Parelaphostrongylus tenuis]|uniref:Uncharacterized protein n=1 Tax=Parelaphostrongylus tenuis TaxID=148309 RepID=A0AAD5MWQ9_PARTN|nr:hypothetical protein KIN20_008385 [Parelaphostrongylus tenuis]
MTSFHRASEGCISVPHPDFVRTHFRFESWQLCDNCEEHQEEAEGCKDSDSLNLRSGNDSHTYTYRTRHARRRTGQFQQTSVMSHVTIRF